MCTMLLFLSSEDQQQGRMEVYGSSCWGSRFSYGVHPNRDSIHKEINHYSVPARIIGSLNNHNDNDNNNIKKQLVLWAKQPCMCITHFSTLLWCPLHNYDVKPPSVMFYEGCDEHTSTKFPFSSGFNSRRNCLHLTNIDKVWKDTNSSLAMFSLPSWSSSCAAILAFCS